MKNLESSDINTNQMVLFAMNNSAVRLPMPVSTYAIWGLDAFASRSSAIWGTSAVPGASRKQNFSAIWGTSGIWSPVQHARTSWLSME